MRQDKHSLDSGYTNITVDLRLWDTSGIGKYLQNIVPPIVKAFRTKRFTLLGDKLSLSKVNWSENVVNIVEFTSPIYSVEEQFVALKVIPCDCDLLWWPHWNIPIFFQKSIVTTIYDAFHLRIPRTCRNIFKTMYTSVLFKAVKHKSLMSFTLSKFSKNELIKLTDIKPDRIHVTNLAVDEAWILHETSEVITDTPYIVYVGNVKPHKNLRTLVKAFIQNIDKIPHKLVIIGKKEGFITADMDVQRLAQRYPDKIEFTGWIDDASVRNYVANAAFMVFPTLYEGFGIPPLEAMTVGCPVLASDIPVIREVCEDAALYFDPKNSQDLSELILSVAIGSRDISKIIKKGRERALHFKWSVSIKKTIDIFEALFNAAKSGEQK